MYSTTAKKLLCLTLVQSRLTHCSQLWRPHLLKDISILRKVQRRLTKYVHFDDYILFPRLICFDQLSLMYQYELSDLHSTKLLTLTLTLITILCINTNVTIYQVIFIR